MAKGRQSLLAENHHDLDHWDCFLKNHHDLDHCEDRFLKNHHDRDRHEDLKNHHGGLLLKDHHDGLLFKNHHDWDGDRKHDEGFFCKERLWGR